ncbi:hypothetical protein CBR_g44353 [Chara braunii]|uniref:Peptidase A1 domain-containing protein n=1 Tax=Chara braunii TaxID=69332 RepID=A0A388K345_CHABU|nr:hypothetical protein CBR_g44353 [Chara braunii]|eukprot:GBG64468.1 hypothetical protein CBR_g44353 [Chara braunii]
MMKQKTRSQAWAMVVMATAAASSSDGFGMISRRRDLVRNLLLSLVMGVFMAAGFIGDCLADSPSPSSLRLPLKVRTVRPHEEDLLAEKRKLLFIGSSYFDSFPHLLGSAPPSGLVSPSSSASPSELPLQSGPRGFSSSSSSSSSPSPSPLSSSLSSTPSSLTSTPLRGRGSISSSSLFAPPLSSSSSSSSSHPPSPGDVGSLASTPSSGRASSRVSTVVALRNRLKTIFTVDVMMGTPPTQTRSLIVGFDDYITWTFCTPAVGSLQLQEPVNLPFAPALSSSYSLATCQSPGCKALQATARGACQAGGTSCALALTSKDQKNGIAGQLVSDYVMLRADSSSRILFDSIGCVTEIKGSYVNFSADGTLALGPANGTFFAAVTQQLELPQILNLCFNATGYLSRASTSGVADPAAVINDSGSVVFGMPPPWVVYPSFSIGAPLQTTDLSLDTPWANYISKIRGWTVVPSSSSSSSSSSSLSTVLQPPGTGLVFFDSAFLTYLPKANLTVITDAIQLATGLIPDPDFEDLIVYSQPLCDVTSFPTVTFLFPGGVELKATPEEYTATLGSGIQCFVLLGFANHTGTKFMELGLSVLQSKWLTFDFSAPAGGGGAFKVGGGSCSGPAM